MNSEYDCNELDYPDWLYRDLVEDYLPWERGGKISFTEFNKKYTLHDSCWIVLDNNLTQVTTHRTPTIKIGQNYLDWLVAIKAVILARLTLSRLSSWKQEIRCHSVNYGNMARLTKSFPSEIRITHENYQ